MGPHIWTEFNARLSYAHFSYTSSGDRFIYYPNKERKKTHWHSVIYERFCLFLYVTKKADDVIKSDK